MKTCLDCQQTLPLDQFPPAAKRSDGRASYCRVCMRERSKASYRKRVAARGGVVRTAEELPLGHLRCNDCGQVLPLEAFPRNKNTKSGRHSYCKPCHNARGRETIERLYGSTSYYHRRGRYGLTEGEYEALAEAQGGLCAICRTAQVAHVDHDHETGVIRGLLCFNCNGGLGQFKDRVDILLNAIRYLSN